MQRNGDTSIFIHVSSILAGRVLSSHSPSCRLFPSMVFIGLNDLLAGLILLMEIMKKMTWEHDLSPLSPPMIVLCCFSSYFAKPNKIIITEH